MVVVNVVISADYGGVANVCRELIGYQNRNNIKSYLVSTDSEETVSRIRETYGLQFDFIPVTGFFRRKFPTLFGLLSKKALRSVASKEDVVVHYHNPISAGLFGVSYPRSVCTIHGYMVSESKISNFIFKKTLLRLSGNGTTLAGCSHKTAEYYKQLLNKEVYAVCNGVSVPTASGNGYGLNEGKCNILFSSYLDELKGWKYLLEAFLSLPAEVRAKAELYFCGGAGPEAGEAVTKASKANPDVHYLGYVENVKEKVLPFSDVVVLPSRSEGLPMSLLEAISLGKVVLATPVGGIPEIVLDGENGFFIERSSGDLKEKLIAVIQDESLCRRLSENAIKHYNRRFSSGVMGDSYLKIYQNTGKD